MVSTGSRAMLEADPRPAHSRMPKDVAWQRQTSADTDELEASRLSLLHSSVDAEEASSCAVFFYSLLVLAFTLPALAQAKHPFTFEDMMKLKRVGDPQVSPDGKWVIFSVVDVDLEANTKTPHIWIVCPTAGGQENSEIIADQDGDRPRWAPDGKRFAFLSTKEGGSQVWIADFDGAARHASLARAQIDFDRDRSQRRALVARWQEHSLHV